MATRDSLVRAALAAGIVHEKTSEHPDAPVPEETIQELIAFAFWAHGTRSKKPSGAVRRHDGKTPYAIHPVWCATMILAETALPEDLRMIGARALILHDILEDTTVDLPPGTSPRVRALVEEMTFESFAEEQERIWDRSQECKLLKLYD